MRDMSFLPEDYLEKRAHRRTNIICVTLFIVVMASVIGAYMVSDQQRMDVKKLRDDVNQRFTEAARRLEQLDQLQQRKQQMLRKARLTSALLERLPRTLILSQLINNMPTNLSVFELEVETQVLRAKNTPARTSLDKAKADTKTKSKKGATPAAEKEAEEAIEIKPTQISVALIGVARTDTEVAQFMTDLKAMPLFASVNLAFSEQLKINDNPMRRFRIETVINQEIDLRKFEPLMVKRDLKMNPMANSISIDEEGRVVKPAVAATPVVEPGPTASVPDSQPDPGLIRNVTDKPRRTLGKE